MRYRFGGFTLDLEESRLLGPEGEIRLRPQAFRLLEVLVESAPKILSQEELLDRAWGVEHLSPASVKQAISEVRQALGDDPARPRIIETVHRRGYRLIAPLERLEPAAPAAMPEPVPEPRPDEHATRPLSMSKILPQAEAPPRRFPPGAWTGRRRAAMLLLPVLAGLAVMTLPGRLGRSLPRRTAPPDRPAVAILGFQNLSARPADAWISSALGEILGFELTAPGRLRVLPAETVARAQRELGVREHEASAAGLVRIGRHLGAHLVISGSYLVSRAAGSSGNETIRIQVMVQDVRTGETVAWARETGASEKLLELATAAARGLLGSLTKTPGTPPEAVALAANAESLRLWSEAGHLLRVRNATAALPLLQKAAGIDPDNPFVHDALAQAWSRLGFDARAAGAAGRALALARDLPDEIRLGLEARAHEMRFEAAESAARYAELWQRFPDNLDYGLALASAQRQTGASEASLGLIEALRRLPPPDGEDPRIDLAESDAAWQLGDFVRCRAMAHQAIGKAEARGAILLVAMGKVSRGWALKRLGESDAALADFQAASAIYRRMGDRAAAGSAQAAEALIHQSQGRPAAARQIYREVIPVFRQIGDRTREARALNNLAALVADEGDAAGAIGLFERSLAIKREIEDLQGTAMTLANLGNLRETQGDARGARPLLEEAMGISRRLGDAYGTAQALRGLARIEAHEGRYAAGRATLAEAIGLSRQNGDAEGLAQAELALAHLEKEAGRPSEARRQYEKALALWTELEDQEKVAEVREALAKLGKEPGKAGA